MAKTQAQNVTQTIYEELFPKTLSKSDLRKMEILDGAIKAYAAVDFHSVSFDEIAGPASTSRRLVQHYFPNKDTLFETSMKIIRAKYQALAVEALSKASTPEEQFQEYILASFYWIKKQPTHVKAWFLFFLVASQKPKFKKTHAELTLMGEQRIIALIQQLPHARSRNAKDLHYLAKSIQRLITGGILEICTEKKPEDIEDVQAQVLRASLALLEM